jgi:hypothetical protein
VAKLKNYQDYLNSDEWKELRAKAYSRANNRCELCANDAQAVHHIQYPKDFKDDDTANLLVVCNICHDKLHGKNLDVPAFNEEGLRQRKLLIKALSNAWFWCNESIREMQGEITELDGAAINISKALDETAQDDILDILKDTKIYTKAEQGIYWLSQFQNIIEETNALRYE